MFKVESIFTSPLFWLGNRMEREIPLHWGVVRLRMSLLLLVLFPKVCFDLGCGFSITTTSEKGSDITLFPSHFWGAFFKLAGAEPPPLWWPRHWLLFCLLQDWGQVLSFSWCVGRDTSLHYYRPPTSTMDPSSLETNPSIVWTHLSKK